MRRLQEVGLTPLAAGALLAALFTAAAVAFLGGGGWHLYGAGVYLLLTGVAIVLPSAIAAQVIGGQLLAGSLVFAPPGAALPWLLAIVAAVVVTAELLAAVARPADPSGGSLHMDLRRTGLAAGIGSGAFVVVAVLSGLPGPTGLVGAALAAGACLALAFLLMRSTA